MEPVVAFLREMTEILAPGEPIADLWLCSAHTTQRGVEALAGLIGTASRCHALLGYTARTEWQALARLLAMGADVRLVPDPPGGRFHARALTIVRAAAESLRVTRRMGGELVIRRAVWHALTPGARARARTKLAERLRAYYRAVLGSAPDVGLLLLDHT